GNDCQGQCTWISQEVRRGLSARQYLQCPVLAQERSSCKTMSWRCSRTIAGPIPRSSTPAATNRPVPVSTDWRPESSPSSVDDWEPRCRGGQTSLHSGKRPFSPGLAASY